MHKESNVSKCEIFTSILKLFPPIVIHLKYIWVAPPKQKYLIQETKHLSTDADTSTDTKKILLVRQNSSKIKLFLRDDFTPFMSKSIQI